MEVEVEDTRYKSRKFRIAIYVLISTPILPIVYKVLEITDTALLGVLGVITAISAGYGIANVKDAKVEVERRMQETTGETIGNNEAP